MFLVTYTDRVSRTGTGVSIVSDVAEFSKGREVISVSPYTREDDSILTPAAIAACIGDSDSL